MSKAFVYTELQVNRPFDEHPWRDVNPVMKQQPGLVRKTWLAGVGAQTVGGFYEFDSIENARRFVVGTFAEAARTAGVAWTTKIFDGDVVEEASRDLRSPFYDGATPILAA